jgi:hypothetical protein
MGHRREESRQQGALFPLMLVKWWPKRRWCKRSITVEGEPDAQVMGQALHGARGYNCRLP